MKKLTIFVATTLMGFGSVHAANVAIYGSLDTGLQYVKTKGAGHTFTIESGQSWGSRVGLRINEDLTNGWKVKSVLESGIASDTGALLYNQDRNRLFGRQATLALTGPYGEFAFGRAGTLSGSVGTYSMWAGWADPLGTAFLDAGIQSTMYGFGRADNAMIYQSPVMNGWQFGAMYSFDAMVLDPTRGEATVGNARKNRLGNLAVTYKGSRLSMQAAVETVMWENSPAFNTQLKNGTDVGLSFQYNLDWAKFWLTGQYMHNVNLLGAHSTALDSVRTDPSKGLVNNTGNGITGYGLAVATRVPVGHGFGYAQLQYFDGEYDYSHDVNKLDMQRVVASLGWIHNLSRSTWLYGVASWSQGGGDWKHSKLTAYNTEDRINRVAFQAGINHRF